MKRIHKLLLTVLADGGGTPFVPTDIAGMKLWLDFSDLTTLYQTNDTSTPVTADGQKIGYVADKSGNGTNVTQATDGNRPTYKASILNSLSVARFVSASNQTLVSATITDIAQPITTYVVCNFPIGSGSYAAVSGKTSGKQCIIYWLGGATQKITAYSGTNLSHTDAYTTAYKVFCATFNGANSFIRIHGSQFNGNAGTQGLDGFLVGNSTAGTAPMGNDITEILVYAGAHDAAQLANVETYLKDKWGLNP